MSPTVGSAVRPALPCSSLPALAAVLRHAVHRKPDAAADLLHGPRLATMYHIHTDSSGNGHRDPYSDLQNEEVASEARAAAHLLAEIADRLRRLAAAYGEWAEFDACAYFDLRPEQAARLVRVVERVSTVHVTFYADALLPSFQAAEAWRRDHYTPARLAAYAAAQGADDLAPALRRFQTAQTRMAAAWARAVAVVAAARTLLEFEATVLAADGGEDEAAAWAWAWAQPPASGVAASLLPALADVPTLTLSIEFPLPAYRQPGRVRRLRRNRARSQRRRASARGASS